MGTHLGGLSSSLGPDCLPWGQWAQAAPKDQLCLQRKDHEAALWLYLTRPRPGPSGRPYYLEVAMHPLPFPLGPSKPWAEQLGRGQHPCWTWEGRSQVPLPELGLFASQTPAFRNPQGLPVMATGELGKPVP